MLLSTRTWRKRKNTHLPGIERTKTFNKEWIPRPRNNRPGEGLSPDLRWSSCRLERRVFYFHASSRLMGVVDDATAAGARYCVTPSVSEALEALLERAFINGLTVNGALCEVHSRPWVRRWEKKAATTKIDWIADRINWLWKDGKAETGASWTDPVAFFPRSWVIGKLVLLNIYRVRGDWSIQRA